MAAREHGKTHDVKRRRWFHSSWVKLNLVNKSSSWVFGVNIFDLDFCVQVDSVKQPIKRNSVSLGHVSHCRTSAFGNHLDYRFIVFNNVKLGAKGFAFCGNVIHNIISGNVFLPLGVRVFLLYLVSPRVSPYWMVFGRMQYFSHQIPEIASGNAIHAQTSIQRDNFRLSNCVRPMFVSCSSN